MLGEKKELVQAFFSMKQKHRKWMITSDYEKPCFILRDVKKTIPNCYFLAMSERIGDY